MNTKLDKVRVTREEGSGAETYTMMNNSEDRMNTPTMDFEDWAADVFSSFGTDEVEMSNSGSMIAPLPPTLTSSTVSLPEGSRRPCGGHRKTNRKRQAQESLNTQRTLDGESNPKRKSGFTPISRRKKKPKGMPKRPLSAYNLYFQAERTKILANQQETQGPRIGFEGLGKIIGAQWRNLCDDDKKEYEKLAEKDSERYRNEMDAYNAMKAKKIEEEEKREASRSSVLSFASSVHSTEQSTFHGQHDSIQTQSVGEGFDTSTNTGNNRDSMISKISSEPHGTKSISYRPVHVDRAIPPPNFAVQHKDIMDALNSTSILNSNNTSTEVDFGNGPHVSRTGSQSYTASTGNNSCPMPPGMEVVLSDSNGVDRKYRVQYTCYSMTRENANRYIESLTGHGNATNHAPLQPGMRGPRGHDGRWRV